MNEKKIETKKTILQKIELYLNHKIIPVQKWLFLLLIIIILAIPFSNNFIKGNPTLLGGETYFHLNQAEEINLNNLHYLPLILIKSLPNYVLNLVPFILAIFFILIFQQVLKQIGFRDKEIFFFLIILILSPIFIFNFSSLSASAYFMILALLGFFFWSHKNDNYHPIALIPFILATFFDLFSTLILLFLQTIYFLRNSKQKEKNFFHLLYPIATIFLLFVHWLILKQTFFLGPFHLQQPFADLISDLGGLSGLGFFVLLLGLIGISITWEKKESWWPYLIFLFLITCYMFSSQTIFFLSLVIIFFATTGFLKLLERKWDLENLKTFTFLLLILGIAFSTITYLDRIDQTGPLANDIEILTLLKESIPPNTIIFSSPEYGDYITYFSHGSPYSTLRDSDQKKNITQKIFTATYLNELTPLLIKEEIYFIYLSKKTLTQLPENQGLPFLVKSEKFKLIYSHENSKVWIFKKDDGNIP